MNIPTADSNYLLAGGAAELERLRLQARVLEPDAEQMLDEIGVAAGWRCIDLGCGGMGILGPLSRRVGNNGVVVGVDMDEKQLAAARQYVAENGLTNVFIDRQDAYATAQPCQSFDFVHVRFVFAPAGHDESLLSEMLALAKPGGVIVIQEPDASSWTCYPSSPAWGRLKQVILEAFRLGGGDFNVGQRTYAMLREAGLQDVHIRSSVIALQGTHPYKRTPVQFAVSLRKRILENDLISEADLDRLSAEVEAIAADPETVVVNFLLNQVWGRKPA